MKNETEALSEKIIDLQEKRTKKLGLLKGQLHATFESLRPINLIKSSLKEVSSSPEIKSSIFGNLIGIGTGFLTKKLWVGHSHNPIKKLFGTLIQFAISNVASKHADNIKPKGENLIQRYLKHRKERKNEFNNNRNDLFI